ncbi:MAG: hypothetical protein GY850_07195, partial [bacterium]|nr:hypothetical protein [bacterium]
KNAEAIKNFLAYAYDNWHKIDHPTYVLLVGDASIDYRDDLGYYGLGNKDFVSTYIYTPPQGNTPSDSKFVCVAGEDDLPDMAIGRLSVKTDEDLQNILSKIRDYEQADPAAWCGNVILAADNEWPYKKLADELADLLPKDLITARKVYIEEYDHAGSASIDFIDIMNAGAVITTFLGHGNAGHWAAKDFFSFDDGKNHVDSLTNTDRLTVAVVLTCGGGYFANAVDDYCLAEELVRAEQKGAVACIASTGSELPSEDNVFAKYLFNDLFINGTKTLGLLFYSAKIKSYNEIGSSGIVNDFTLFGDPATELKLAT